MFKRRKKEVLYSAYVRTLKCNRSSVTAIFLSDTIMCIEKSSKHNPFLLEELLKEKCLHTISSLRCGNYEKYKDVYILRHR
jgi:hypothetical protein